MFNILRIKHLDIKTITILILSIICIGLLLTNHKKKNTEHFNIIGAPPELLTYSILTQVVDNRMKQMVSNAIRDEIIPMIGTEMKQMVSNVIKDEIIPMIGTEMKNAFCNTECPEEEQDEEAEEEERIQEEQQRQKNMDDIMAKLYG